MKKILKFLKYNKTKYLICKAVPIVKICTLILLISLPYLPFKITYILSTLSIILLLTQFKFFYFIKLCEISKKIFTIVMYFVIVNYFIKYNQMIFSINSISCIRLIYYLRLKLSNYTQNIMLKILIFYVHLNIPHYSKKLIELNIMYILVNYHLSLLMKDEIVFQYFIESCHLINKKQRQLSNNYLFSTLISTQILNKIAENLRELYFGIKIKKNISQKKLLIYITLYYNILIQIFLESIYILNISIWNKNIQNKLNQQIHIA